MLRQPAPSRDVPVTSGFEPDDVRSPEDSVEKSLFGVTNEVFDRCCRKSLFALLMTNSPSRRRGDLTNVWGRHQKAMSSPATSVTGLGTCRRTIVACFVFRREISRRAVWDFFDSIDPKLSSITRALRRSNGLRSALHTCLIVSRISDVSAPLASISFNTRGARAYDAPRTGRLRLPALVGPEPNPAVRAVTKRFALRTAATA